MPIPDYQELLLPLLQYAGDGAEHSLRNAVAALADKFQLRDDERRERLPSGQQEVFANRTGWARTYLKKAGLLHSTRRGFFQITDRGRQVLASSPAGMDARFLEQFPEFREFKTFRRKPDKSDSSEDQNQTATPEEALERAYGNLRDELAAELLAQIKQSPPELFERLVVALLVKMGYGGSRQDAGRAIGKSGDEGIDGIIKEDRLGLDVIYIQAKRWGQTVGRPEIQKFAGALQGQRARKGVFITTSDFSREAREFVAHIETKIVLVDGRELAQLLIDCDIGVIPMATYAIKRVDLDYFTEP
ncbi:MAG TPA: restriction endonuclease [Verrucomicrobiota bacterium]|nr:restriction endonuclease [Verrucomicrobiota bacterium]HNT14882.1 restriction endonuclease [Verrucomicrobiota bacterium]